MRGPTSVGWHLALSTWFFTSSKATARVRLRNLPAAQFVRRIWEATWKRLSKSQHRWKLAAGPIAAMPYYLRDMGYIADNMWQWTRPQDTIQVEWGSCDPSKSVEMQLHRALVHDRWRRVASQEDAEGAEKGLDWTVAKGMLKKAQLLLRPTRGWRQLGPAAGPSFLRKLRARGMTKMKGGELVHSSHV